MKRSGGVGLVLVFVSVMGVGVGTVDCDSDGEEVGGERGESGRRVGEEREKRRRSRR